MRLAVVLAQSPALAHLDLSCHEIGEAERLAGVLAHLNLWGNRIGDSGAGSLAGVLGQCAALTHLNLSSNKIDALGKGRLGASWRGQASGLLL
jgi:hypothetical protein